MYRRADVKSEQQENLLNPLHPKLLQHFAKKKYIESALIYGTLVLENVRVEGCIED